MSNEGKKYDVVGLGSCTLDLIFEVDDIMRLDIVDRDKIEKKYICIENSSKLNVKTVKSYPGGSAANISCDLSNIGFKTAYIGGIGADTAGDTCLTDLRNHNVDVSGVKIFSEDSTAHSVILVNSAYKDRSILAYKGANDLYSEKDVPIEKLQNTRCFVWTSLTSDMGIGAIRKCIEITKSSGGIIAAAPSISIIKKRKKDAIKLMRLADLTSLNDEELEEITGIKRDLHAAMALLFEWGIKIVNLTLGKNGQWISDGKTLIKTRPPSIHVMDTTGAGDATMSGIIYGFLENKSLHDTAMIAASLSAMEIEATGVRVGLPDKFSELQTFINNHEFQQETSNF
ncbi:carbohydrate kinase family protein [Promethearchaeum syntrophicum]|uniref:Carbohydrate kinase family protein n=1 Tax=Promethearchaeum syntrophicum TaxID=2594042 RepID=A0A5B9DFJ4_9ARCH|nr:carbohydrate kinase family protein [Candidatus Prometheoarchaeum syntrophicum]QEE17892.1 putative sugar kinase [Candidatus Prometheoarchaeum syntrophicum]